MQNDTRSAVVIAVVQFLFSTCWLVYALYLKDLLRAAGLDPSLFLWVILLDQLVFALTDTAMGLAADRVERALGRLGPFLVGTNAVACLLFISLPLVAGLEGLPGRGPLLLVAILLWVGTSSVLRAPPLVLLAKYAARPRTPWLAALLLSGLALAGAAAPYLGSALKGLDPLLPFTVTGLTLLASTLPLVALERRRIAAAAGAPALIGREQPDRVGVLTLAVGALFVGLGFQVQAFVSAAPQYLRFTDAASLVWLLPLFWVGFQLAVFPGAWAARRHGEERVLGAAALAGGLALWGSSHAGGLGQMIAWQILAGGAWGILLTAGLSTAVGLGRVGCEGLVSGIWFSMLSLAALLRLGLVLSGVNAGTQAPWLAQLPWGAWLLGAAPLLYLATRPEAGRGTGP
jgi:hypothetical protein